METSKSKGFRRAKDIPTSLGIPLSSWWRGVKEGRFPPPIKLATRTTAWRNSDLDELEELLVTGKDWRDHKDSV